MESCFDGYISHSETLAGFVLFDTYSADPARVVASLEVEEYSHAPTLRYLQSNLSSHRTKRSGTTSPATVQNERVSC